MRLPTPHFLTQKPYCFSTVGDGNCGIHAMFGEWNDAYRGIFSSNAAEIRSVVAVEIATCPIDSPLFLLLIEPITTIMQDFKVLSKNFNWLKTVYYRELKEIDAATSACKSTFIDLLPSVEAGLREIYSVYLNEKQGVVLPPKDLFAVFSICIAEKQAETMTFLEGHRELKDAYNAYIESLNKTVSVASILGDDVLRQGVLEEYARYINVDKKHLLPSELQIFAFVHDKHVVYYPSKDASENHFNPTGRDTVTIVFDGVNHYEKALSKKPLMNEKKLFLSKLLKFFEVETLTNEEMFLLAVHYIKNSKKEFDFITFRSLLTVCDELLNQQYGKSKKTLLHVAVEERKSEMVEFLLHNGADAQIVDALGYTPKMRASNVLEIMSIFNRFDKEFRKKLTGQTVVVPKNAVEATHVDPQLLKEENGREELAALFVDSVIHSAMNSISEKPAVTPINHAQQHDEAKSKAHEIERFIAIILNTMFTRAIDQVSAKKVTLEDKQHQYKRVAGFFKVQQVTVSIGHSIEKLEVKRPMKLAEVQQFLGEMGSLKFLS